MRLPVFVTTVLLVVSQLVGCSRTGDGSKSRVEATVVHHRK